MYQRMNDLQAKRKWPRKKYSHLLLTKNTRMRITKGMFDITCFGKLYSRIFCTILVFCISLYDNPYLKSLDRSHSFFYVLFCILNANSIETLNHRVTHPIWPTMGFPGQESQYCISALFTENPPEEIFWRFAICFTRGSGEIIRYVWLIWSDDMWNPHCIHQLAFKWCFLHTFTFTCECTAPQTSTSQPPASDNHFTTFRMKS